MADVLPWKCRSLMGLLGSPCSRLSWPCYMRGAPSGDGVGSRRSSHCLAVTVSTTPFPPVAPCLRRPFLGLSGHEASACEGVDAPVVPGPGGEGEQMLGDQDEDPRGPLSSAGPS
jgi:hypothetical protein